MVNFFTKIGLAGGAVSGVLLIDGSSANFRVKEVEKKIEQAVNEDLKTIEDIELFEKTYGCSFVYISSWENKLLYSAREIVEKVKSEGRNIEQEIITGANLENTKNEGKNKKGVITLNNSNPWKVAPPKGGW